MTNQCNATVLFQSNLRALLSETLSIYDNARAARVTVGPFHITLDCTFFVAVVVVIF